MADGEKSNGAPPAKKPMGRPKIHFDLDLVEKLGGINATHAELAAILDCSVATIKRNLRDAESDFCTSYKKGEAKLKTSLKRKLVHLALRDSPNTACLIFALKNICGYTDKSDVAVEHSGALSNSAELMQNWKEVLGVKPADPILNARN